MFGQFGQDLGDAAARRGRAARIAGEGHLSDARLGHVLQGVRPGVEKVLYHDPALKSVPETLTLESAAFTSCRRTV